MMFECCFDSMFRFLIRILRFLGCFDILINNDVPMTQALVVLEDAVTNIRIKESTNQIFNDSAINTIKSSKYKPAFDSSNNPVYFKNLSIVIEFNLN